MAKNPNPSTLDPGQIIKRAFQESDDSFRVDAAVTITSNISGAQEVIISDVDDSIKIGNGSGTFAQVTNANALKTDSSATTQPISASSLPLPTGAATSANQSTEISSLSSIDTKLSSQATAANQTTGNSSLSSIDSKIITVNTNSVTITSSVLPTGASTLTAQNTGNTSLASIDSKLTSPITVTGPLTDTQLRASAVPVSQSGTWNVDLNAGSNTIGKIDQGLGGVSAWKVDGSATTQPISAVSLPLPSGASTAANQTTEIASLTSLDSKTIHVDTGNVTVVSSSLPTGAATAALQTQPGVDIGDVTVNNTSGAGAVNIQDGGNSITVDGTIASTQSGTWNINNISGTISLPTGAATQTTLAEIAIDTDNLDVALSTRLKPSDTLNAVTTLGTITNVVHVDDNAGSLTVDNNGTFATQASQSGTWNINNISGTISLPTGASTSALQTTGNTSLASIDSKLTSPLTVTVNNFPADVDALAQASTTLGQLGNLNMGAVTTSSPTYTTSQTSPLSLTTVGALRVDGSGVTQPISAVSLPLPTGAATSANQTTEIASLASIDSKLTSPLTVQGSKGTLTDRSGTATNTSTQIMGVNSNRRYLYIKNVGTNALWFNFTTTATASQPSIQLVSGEDFIMNDNFISTEAINIIRSAGTNVPYTAKEG